MNYSSYAFEIPCAIVGAGSAGYGAAVAALREKCPVWVVDRHGYFGGMATAANLSSFINYRHAGNDLSEAGYRELIAQLARIDSGYRGDGGHVDFFEPEACKRLMETNVLRTGGRILYHSLLHSVRRDGDHWLLRFLAKGAEVTLRARYLIDATGDADVSALAGAKMRYGRSGDGKVQPMSMVVQLGGFSTSIWAQAGGQLIEGKYATGGDVFAEEIKQARAAGEWNIPRDTIAMWWSMPGDPSRVTVNGSRLNGYDACNPLDVTAAEIEGRKQAEELARFFKKYIPGFARSYLVQTGPQVGVRESRRITGKKTLTESDVMSCHQPEDTVVKCAYPIDIHQPDGSGTRFEHGKQLPYGIPFGCLVPEDLQNVLAAGRCISATHEAAGSFRVMPTCMAIGEAAGTAVALAHRNNISVDQVSATDIRTALDAALVTQ